MGCLLQKVCCLSVSTSDSEEDVSQLPQTLPGRGSRHQGLSENTRGRPLHDLQQIDPVTGTRSAHAVIKQKDGTLPIRQMLDDSSKWNAKTVKIVETIREGKYCDRYKVRHLESGEEALLKISKNKRRKSFSRYTAEDYIWNIASDHPYVADFLGSYHTNQKFCLVSKFYHGGDLKTIVRTRKSLPQGIIKIIAAQIASAIFFLHTHEIFHRNVCNKSIMISADGKAHLSNFDFAVMTTTSRGLHGSYRYQAPEVYSGEIYDLTADWYSFGVCLYEMVMEETPIERDCAIREINLKSLDYSGKIVVMLTSTVHIDDNLSSNVKAVLTQFLNKDPKKRLGYKDDASKIKLHPFFIDVNWDDLEKGLVSFDLPLEPFLRKVS